MGSKQGFRGVGVFLTRFLRFAGRSLRWARTKVYDRDVGGFWTLVATKVTSGDRSRDPCPPPKISSGNIATRVEYNALKWKHILFERR